MVQLDKSRDVLDRLWECLVCDARAAHAHSGANAHPAPSSHSQPRARILSTAQVLAMIGEVLDDRNDVLGIVVSRRYGKDKLAVWNAKCSDATAVLALGCVDWWRQGPRILDGRAIADARARAEIASRKSALMTSSWMANSSTRYCCASGRVVLIPTLCAVALGLDEVAVVLQQLQPSHPLSGIAPQRPHVRLGTSGRTL